jgi:hypothetical protein
MSERMSEWRGADDGLVRSYLAVRTSIGVVGMALPFVLVLGGLAVGTGLQTSVSAYYHTGMRDIFVGSLCAIAVFLWSYRGYDERDDRAGTVASVAALGVALLPTAPLTPWSGDALVGGLHVASAAVFFGTLAYFSLRLFRLSGRAVPTDRKLARNRVYTVCGYAIIGAMVAIAIVSVPPVRSAVAHLRPVLWLEALAVVAFGVSWFTKGEAILGDREGPEA